MYLYVKYIATYMYLYVSIGIYVCASVFANMVKNKNYPYIHLCNDLVASKKVP